MNIGDIAKAAGILAKMIRCSEQTGLIRPAARALSGYRVYSDNDLLTLSLDRSRARANVNETAMGHVAALEKKIQGLKDMSDTLLHLASHGHDDDRPDGQILKTPGCAEAAAPPPKTLAFGRGH